MDSEKKISFTWRVILMGLSIIAAIFYFFPVYKVDVFFVKLSISFANITFGNELYRKFTAIYLLIVPIAVFLLWFFIKKFEEKKIALITAILEITNVIYLIRVLIGGAKASKESYDMLHTTIVPWIMLLISLAIACIAALIAFDKLKTDATIQETSLKMEDLKDFSSELIKATASAANKAANSVAKATQNVGKTKVCKKCGAKMSESSQFCSACGEKYVETVSEIAATADIIQNDSSDDMNQTEKMCSECGTKVDEDQLFCTKCGAKL